MRIFVKIAVVPLTLFFLSFLAFSQIYKWKDKDGNLHISSTPPPPGVQWEKKNPQEALQNQKPNDAAAAKPANQPAEEQKIYRDIKVILYETDWCPYCRKAGEYLKSLGVNLIRYDIDKNPEKREEKLRKAPGFTDRSTSRRHSKRSELNSQFLPGTAIPLSG
jgi:hypothetical protein